MALALDLDFDPDPLWHSVGGGALVAATVTVLRVCLEYRFRHHGRRLDRADRERAFQRDAEARLERVLQDRLSEADRRLDRCEFEIDAERARRTALQHDHALLSHAHETLREQYGALHSEHSLLLHEYRLLIERAQAPDAEPRAPDSDQSSDPASAAQRAGSLRPRVD